MSDVGRVLTERERAFHAELRERRRLDGALKADPIGALFLAYEQAMQRAVNADRQIEASDWPTKKRLDAARALWKTADEARAALAYAIIGETVP